MVNLISIILLLSTTCYCFNTISKNLEYSKEYIFTVNNSVEYVFEYTEKENHLPPRITVSSEHPNISRPLMVVARQPKEMLSFQIPLMLESETGYHYFNNMSRTLCHNHSDENGTVNHDSPIVTVSTASKTDITFKILVDYQDSFYVNTSMTYTNFTISPSEPKYFMYKFPSKIKERKNSSYDTVLLEIDSEDLVCMTVSIQNCTCPVFDSNEDITFRGFYETVGRKGAMTIPKSKFPHGFYIVFVPRADDYACTGQTELSTVARNKQISFRIRPSINYSDYRFAIWIILAPILGFYILFGLPFLICIKRIYNPRTLEYIDQADTSLLDPSINEGEEDIEDRPEWVCLYLSDLAKNPDEIKKKTYLYLYNVLTIAIFYGLPVIQLVITYQNVLNDTGKQDLCFYNFLCAHPYGLFSDFNHLYSNISYVFFGILFIIIVYRRSRTHCDQEFERHFGIPQHYGLFYAMGVSLIVEGVLSASYHICPTPVTFQFDSSFMYVMVVLCCIKLYQNRHSDVNANAYTTFGVLAVAIVLGLIGILQSNIYFWVAFTLIHLAACLYISCHVYYMGCWKLDRRLFIQTYRALTRDPNLELNIDIMKPVHRARMVLLLVGNIFNWGLAIGSLVMRPKDFPLYILEIFMMNTMLYFAFYSVMKIIHKEKMNKVPIIFMMLSVSFAISAVFCFMQKIMSQSGTAAQSRVFNQECTLLRFYDFHDIWHFLSAICMFFTFMVLLTLDDDLSHTPRTKIRIF